LRRGKEGVSLPLDRCCWLHFPSLCLAFSHITHLTDWHFCVINLCHVTVLNFVFVCSLFYSGSWFLVHYLNHCHSY
jgi:hypothetical protein